jgi:zinc protease
VRDGFFAADVQDVRASRMMVLAGRVLSTRMVRVLREERQLVYSIGAQSRPGEAYPGFGVFAAQAPTDPGKAEALGEAITEMFAAFAAQGPSAEELAVAKHQLVNLVDETIKGAEFWIDRLATVDYRGLSLDDLARISADYQGFTVDEIRETFARYFRPEGRFRIAILPEPRR